MNRIIIAFCLCAEIVLTTACSSAAYENVSVDSERIGNVLSGGYIAEHDGLYYFFKNEINYVYVPNNENTRDEYNLYSMDMNMENVTKLNAEPYPSFNSEYAEIQVVGKKLFYLRRGESVGENGKRPTLLYAYDIETGTESGLGDLDVWHYTIFDGWIYFTVFDSLMPMHDVADVYKTNVKLYKMRCDGSEQILLAENLESGGQIQVAGGKIYLFGWPNAFATMNIDGSDIKYQELLCDSLIAYKGNLYYARGAEENQKVEHFELFRASLSDISAGGTKIFGGDIGTFTIAGDVIYFENSDDGGIYKMNLDGGEAEYIVDGCCPVVLGEYLFYDNAASRVRISGE